MLNKRGYIVGGIVIVIITIVLLTNNWRVNNFLKNAKSTNGKIISYYPDARGSGTIFRYTYVVNGITYRGGLLSYRIINEGVFVGREYPLLYSSKSPDKSMLLVFPENFEEMGRTFPDSLKWVENYRR